MEVFRKRQRPGDNGDSIDLTGRPKQSLRILVVDDNHDCAVSLCFLCRHWGHDTQYCYDGATALRLVEPFRPHVFLLDIAMPLMSGYDLAHVLRGLPPFEDTLLIAVSGYADEPHRVQAADCGFNQYLAKPADLGKLENLLRSQADGLLKRMLPAMSDN